MDEKQLESFKQQVIEYIADLEERLESIAQQQKKQLEAIQDGLIDLHQMLVSYQGLIEGIYQALLKGGKLDPNEVRRVQKDFIESYVRQFQQEQEVNSDAVEQDAQE